MCKPACLKARKGPSAILHSSAPARRTKLVRSRPDRQLVRRPGEGGPAELTVREMWRRRRETGMPQTLPIGRDAMPVGPVLNKVCWSRSVTVYFMSPMNLF
jgi:hypothetical protein